MPVDGWDIDFNALWAEMVNFYYLIASISISFTGSDGSVVTVPLLWFYGGVLILDAIINLIMGFDVSREEAFDDIDPVE